MQISRKIEYGLRATLFLASLPQGQVVPFREIARRIENELKYPGEIKVTVIREHRVIEYAR